MPRIPDDILDSTFFLYPSKEDAEKGARTGGSGFVVAFPSERVPDITYFYGVTNWHVAVQGGFSVIRLNAKVGGIEIIEFGPEDWVFDVDGDDLAVIDFPQNLIPPNAIESNCSLKPIPSAMIYKREVTIGTDQLNVGLGDDVFMLGRFVEQDDGSINAPTARFGCISSRLSMIEQRGPKTELRERFLLDMHSRSGYSGSPVFAYRTPGTNLKNTFKNAGVADLSRSMLCLIGVHVTQFYEELRVKERGGEVVYGPSGVTCAVPSWKILDLINGKKFKAERARSDVIWANHIQAESN